MQKQQKKSAKLNLNKERILSLNQTEKGNVLGGIEKPVAQGISTDNSMCETCTMGFPHTGGSRHEPQKLV